jgi:hypothetical protein
MVVDMSTSVERGLPQEGEGDRTRCVWRMMLIGGRKMVKETRQGPCRIFGIWRRLWESPMLNKGLR